MFDSVRRLLGAGAVGLFALAAVCLWSTPASAHERHFTYSYEPNTIPGGEAEIEQWATLRSGKETGVFEAWDLRTEFEFGLTDRLTTAVYLNYAAERIQDSTTTPETDVETFEFEGLTSEWKYKFTDPTADPIGTLGYLEIEGNGHEVEGEAKIVLGKNVGPWIFAANLIWEHEFEWEDEDGQTVTEQAAEFAQTFGAMWTTSTEHGGVGVGVEFHHVSEYERFLFDEHEAGAGFFGPVVHYGTEGWWATLTVTPQVFGDVDTGRTDELDLEHFEMVEARLIFGVVF